MVAPAAGTIAYHVTGRGMVAEFADAGVLVMVHRGLNAPTARGGDGGPCVPVVPVRGGPHGPLMSPSVRLRLWQRLGGLLVNAGVVMVSGGAASCSSPQDRAECRLSTPLLSLVASDKFSSKLTYCSSPPLDLAHGSRYSFPRHADYALPTVNPLERCRGLNAVSHA